MDLLLLALAVINGVLACRNYMYYSELDSYEIYDEAKSCLRSAIFSAVTALLCFTMFLLT